MENDSKAIVPVSATTALEPTNINDAFFLAQKLVQSGLLGKSIQKPESALAVILAGRELGLTAMQSLRSIYVIEGKPTLSADLMVALVKRSPKCKYFKLIESTDKVATYETDRDGEGVTRMSWTIEQAQAAGVTGKDNWKKYPAAMLRARCIASLARAVYPDLLAGVYEENEIVASSPAEPLRSMPTTTSDSTVDVEFTSEEQESDEEKIERWTSVIANTQTVDQLKTVAKAIKGEMMPDAVRQRVVAIYKDKKTALEAPAGEAA